MTTGDEVRLEVENLDLRRLLEQAGIDAAEQKGTQQLQRNLKLLKDYPGFEVVVDYSNGRKAILLIDKGTSGEQAFKEAFAAWGQ